MSAVPLAGAALLGACVAAPVEGHAFSTAVAILAAALLGLSLPPACRAWFMLTGNRHVGRVTFNPGQIVIDSPAVLARKWVIEERDIATIAWISSTGTHFEDRRSEPARGEAKPGQSVISVEAAWPTGRPVIVVRFSQRLTPPARWTLIPTYGKTMHLAPRHGRPVAGIVLRADADPIEVKRLLERWGARFPQVI